MGKRTKPSKRGKHHGRCSAKAEHSVQWLQAEKSVIKILLGRSEGCSHSYKVGTIRCTSDVLGGFNIKVYDSIGVIDGYVQVADTDRLNLQDKIKERFPT